MAEETKEENRNGGGGLSRFSKVPSGIMLDLLLP